MKVITRIKDRNDLKVLILTWHYGDEVGAQIFFFLHGLVKKYEKVVLMNKTFVQRSSMTIG